MPEYPDITIYIERLEAHIKGQILEQIRLSSPFLLRTAQPSIDTIKGSAVVGFERLGKRIIFLFPDDFFLILHLMISGRLRWLEKGSKITGKFNLAALDFPNGSLIITEAGLKKRASLHLVKGRDELKDFDPGGLEVFDTTFDNFHARLTCENHTLKRALTDPRLFSGIGNAYSDEILHRARLSPILLTNKLTRSQTLELYNSTRAILLEWTQRLRNDVGDGFPEKVTAFHDDMAVHGRFMKPCPVCSTPVQRIRYANNETNYCPGCQTNGKLLADRALSRLLKKDWPRTLEALEEIRHRK